VRADRNIDGARVILNSCTPIDGAVFLSHALGVMGMRSESGDFLLRHSKMEPTTFIDVVAFDAGTTEGDKRLFFCYAIEALQQPLPSDRYEFELKLEAGGTECTAAFVCQLTNEGITMVRSQDARHSFAGTCHPRSGP
jgi:hypothetical protein